MIEDDVYTLLASCGTAFPVVAKQSQQLPYMVYSVVSNNPSNHKDGVSRLDVSRLQVDIYGLTYSSVLTLYQAVRTALDSYSSGNIQHITFDNYTDLFEDSAESYHRAVDFMIRVKR